jgi:plastocyanin
MRAAAVASLVLALVLPTGCSSSSAADPPASHTQPAASTPSVPSSGLGNGQFGMGTKVRITSSGFQPQVLVTGMGLRVTWTNDSSTTQSVHFDNWGAAVDSGPIKPGQSWTFKADHTASVLYHSTYHPAFLGQLQIQLTGNGNEPGG